MNVALILKACADGAHDWCDWEHEGRRCQCACHDEPICKIQRRGMH